MSDQDSKIQIQANKKGMAFLREVVDHYQKSFGLKAHDIVHEFLEGIKPLSEDIPSTSVPDKETPLKKS